MSAAIPLIRAGAIVPIERWLLANGRPAAAWLREVDLPPEPHRDVMRPLALHAVLNFLMLVQEREGPDIGCRVVTSQSILDLDVLAGPVLTSATPRCALNRIASIYPRHSSHEIFYLAGDDTGVSIHGSFAMKMPLDTAPEAAHVAHQYLVMLALSLCRTETPDEPLPVSIKITPHPRHGLDHLVPWFGADIAASASCELVATFPNALLDRQLPWYSSDVLPLRNSHAGDRVGARSLAESARILIDFMIEEGEPSIDRLAAAAGRSRRTMQRMLAAEDTSFADLLDQVRYHRALAQIAEGDVAVADIARELGDSNPSSLTRAVRRWTDESPRNLRRHVRRGN